MKKIFVSAAIFFFCFSTAAEAGTTYRYRTDDCRYYNNCASTRAYVAPNRLVSDHAHWNGSSWICDSGYQRIGDFCELVPATVPRHAHREGSRWVCDDGYSAVNGSCVLAYVPSWAYYTNTWTNNVRQCDTGYSWVNGECRRDSSSSDIDMDYWRRRCDQNHRQPEDAYFCTMLYKTN